MNPIEDEMEDILDDETEETNEMPKEKHEKKKKFTCKYCGEVFDMPYQLATHSKSCEARLEAIEKEMEEKKEKLEDIEIGGPPLPSKTKMTPREYVLFYGEEGLQKLKRERLVEFLTVAPGVGKRTVGWILKQYDLDETARRDPNALMSLLQSGGIKDHIAYRIVNAIIALENEYSDIIKQQVQPYGFYPPQRHEPTIYPPPIQPPRRLNTWREPFPPPRPYQPQYPQSYGYPYYPPRPEDIARRIADELKREFQQTKTQEQTQPQPNQVVTITEPLRDAEGRLIYDKDGNPVYRKVTGPINQLGLVSQEDPELKILKKGLMWRDLFGAKQETLDEDKIRTIIREETKKEEEKLTKEDLERAASEAAARVLAAKEQEDREEKRFERLERAIRESAAAKTVEGYREDAYRLLGQGLQTFANREPKTVKIIVEGVKDILYGPAPTTKEVEPGASEGIFEKLSRKYIAEE